jgi:uncharacterized protein YndB with AHSA1/START domain
MKLTIPIAPVRTAIRVNAAQQIAFEVFTSGIGRWWPKDLYIGPCGMKEVKVEPRCGGRVYELDLDNAEVTWGVVQEWNPCGRVVFTWQITSQWQPEPNPDRKVNSEVEVRFTADSAEWTMVELEHRDFCRMGLGAGSSIRDDVDRSWPGILDAYAREVALRH